ncbi:glycosyltransferase family 4 protein [Nocardioides sp. BP30]|uniref:glycosyltransferase family 4 protein n=1 Tax=Nocardioides sp. BP30 TaxID=3036374 RepID=UPI002468D0B2|nr:glycosyltransferase family 4 protein [Nocardioides sp. BP30]WGL51001.1 glycosyltransferase family 4 protein [Nocardioides sp. BP30]
MRIVQLITQARGGPVDHAVEMALAFAERGHDSHLIGPPGDYADRLRGSSAHWHGAAMSGALDLRGGRAVVRHLARLRPDVLHAQDRRAGLLGRLWARRATPCVYTLHGVPDSLADLVPGNVAVAPRRRRDGLAYLRAERQLARLSGSVVVTPCEAVATYARRHVGVPADRVVVVPNGVAVDVTVDAAIDAAGDTGGNTGGDTGHDRAVRAARGADPTPDTTAPLAVWLGVMAPVKRVDLLVRAVAQVPGLRLRLVGDGPERAVVEATIDALHLRDRVELTGFLAEPEAALAEADLFVLPSAAEACPLALLQAMALGLPAIVTRAGGLPEVVRDGVEGLLVETDDVRALTTALDRLARDPALRSLLGDAARARALSDLTAARCADRLLDVYREVAR